MDGLFWIHESRKPSSFFLSPRRQAISQASIAWSEREHTELQAQWEKEDIEHRRKEVLWRFAIPSALKVCGAPPSQFTEAAVNHTPSLHMLRIISSRDAPGTKDASSWAGQNKDPSIVLRSRHDQPHREKIPAARPLMMTMIYSSGWIAGSRISHTERLRRSGERSTTSVGGLRRRPPKCVSSRQPTRRDHPCESYQCGGAKGRGF